MEVICADGLQGSLTETCTPSMIGEEQMGGLHTQRGTQK